MNDMRLFERQHAVEAAFRFFFSLIFLVAGSGHLVRPEKIAGRLEQAPMGHLATQVASPELLVVMTGFVLLVGGLALLFGYRVRIAAILLIAVLIPITITAQVGVQDVGPLFKNIALLGGLLHFASNGGGAWSLEQRLVSRSQRAVPV